MILVIFEALEQILVDRGGLFVLQLGANRVFSRVVIFEVSIFVAHALELLDFVDGAEFGLEILVDKFLVNLVRLDALILEDAGTRQIVLVAGVVVHAGAPLFADGELFGLRTSRREGQLLVLLGRLFLLNRHQSDAFGLVVDVEFFVPLFGLRRACLFVCARITILLSASFFGQYFLLVNLVVSNRNLIF